MHEQVVGQQPLDLQQVQADEIKVKSQGQTLWMALALMVSTRLWLGGVRRPKRDLRLIGHLMQKVRQVALCRPLLIAVDGLVSYIKATRLSSPLHTGEGERPRLLPWPDIAITQVVKQRKEGDFSIQRRIVQGSEALVQRLLAASQGEGGINTAYIERLNAAFRQRVSALARRSRALTRTAASLAASLTAAMYLTGCVYNFCTWHESLRLSGSNDHCGRRRWQQRTPWLLD